uniref:Uncharacterized protein n=1 Tax=Anser brachyrhynchus TaxID=132585 RepID=A0A8B9BRI7_9AVES
PLHCARPGSDGGEKKPRDSCREVGKGKGRPAPQQLPERSRARSCRGDVEQPLGCLGPGGVRAASHGSEPLAGLPGWPPARLPCQSYPGQPCPMPHRPGTHRAGWGMDGLDPIHGAERLQDGAGALFLARRGG